MMLRAICASLLAYSLALGNPAVAKEPPSNAPQPAPGKQPNRTALRADIDRLMKDFDKNHDGYISREEAPPFLRANFDRLDTNKDGKLSPEELERGAVVTEPRRPSDLVFALIEMSDCDDNCSGEIQRVYDALRKLDTNKDGKIDAAELQVMRQQLIEDRVDQLFKNLDTNKDGKISRDEARGQLLKDFNRLDTNKDGFIDRNELLRAASEKPPRPPANGATPPNPSPPRRPGQPENGGR